MKTNKGFTLIEMLVVVAIIGILSAVVLTALGPSRAKARDARVISGVNQVRVLAEIWFSNQTPSSYTGFTTLTDPPDVKSITTDITQQGGSLVINVSGGSGAPVYAAYSALPSDPTHQWYCVDSRGKAGVLAASPVGAFQCGQ